MVHKRSKLVSKIVVLTNRLDRRSFMRSTEQARTPYGTSEKSEKILHSRSASVTVRGPWRSSNTGCPSQLSFSSPATPSASHSMIWSAQTRVATTVLRPASRSQLQDMPRCWRIWIDRCLRQSPRYSKILAEPRITCTDDTADTDTHSCFRVRSYTALTLLSFLQTIIFYLQRQ